MPLQVLTKYMGVPGKSAFSRGPLRSGSRKGGRQSKKGENALNSDIIKSKRTTVDGEERGKGEENSD